MEEFSCWSGLCRPFTNYKNNLAHNSMKNTSKTQDCEQLQSFIWQEWDSILLPEVQQWVSSQMFTQCCCYTMLLLHSEKHGPVPSLFCAPLWIKYWFIRFSFYWHFTVFNFNVWRRRHNQKRALGPDSKDWGNMVSLEGDHLGDFSANNNK